MDDRPTVFVAMATYNGLPWIKAQTESILNQQGVQVRLMISDDGSIDGTEQWLECLAKKDQRVTVLPPRSGPAGAGPNFLRLASHVTVGPGEYLAFADQDDLWHPQKLADQLQFISETQADATSSNVVSFDETGKRRFINKAQPQRKWDFIAEAPGPGSTFVLGYRGVKMMQRGLKMIDQQQVWLHDWMIYALVRAAGGVWRIDPRPHVAYRQHEDNVLGAHRGWPAMVARWRNLRNGRYREQFCLVAGAAYLQGEQYGRSAEWLMELSALSDALADPSVRGRIRLAPFLPQMRRKPADRLTFGTAGLLGVW